MIIKKLKKKLLNLLKKQFIFRMKFNNNKKINFFLFKKNKKKIAKIKSILIENEKKNN